MTKQQKLERWAEKEIRRNIDQMIVPNEHDGYIVFGRYQIEPADVGVKVTTLDDTIHHFGSKRSAVSWCVADKQNNINLAQQILVLDRKQNTLSADIQCRKAQADRGKTQEFYEIVNTKIQPKIAQQASVTAELEKCIKMAKYMQIRGFNNETARTSGIQAI